MLTRRAALTLPLLIPAAARAQGGDWRTQIREIRYGVSSAENERDAIARHEGMAAYFQQRLGVPMRIFRSTDYAGLVEAMRANQIEFARFGPANYALARRVLGERVAPIARDVDNEGLEGYHSIVFVKADSPARSMDDLRGKSFAFADPNSTSGFAFPSYYLKRQGYDPAAFFGRTGFSGSHEQSVIAVLNGTFDAAATFWSNPQRGNIQRMEEKGMIPPGATRILWTSPLIPNSPYVMRTDLPEALRREFTDALMALPEAAPEVWKQVGFNASRLAPARHEDYLDVIAVVEENAARRRDRRT